MIMSHGHGARDERDGRLSQALIASFLRCEHTGSDADSVQRVIQCGSCLPALYSLPHRPHAQSTLGSIDDAVGSFDEAAWGRSSSLVVGEVGSAAGAVVIAAGGAECRMPCCWSRVTRTSGQAQGQCDVVVYHSERSGLLCMVRSKFEIIHSNRSLRRKD